MMAVTVGGEAGAGGIEVGRLVARRIDGSYVQKQAIRRVARQLGSSVEAVVRKELAYHSRWKRAGHKLEVWLNHMGRTWAGDPWGMHGNYFNEVEPLPGRKLLPGEISDVAYREAIFDNARRYLQEGNVVLTHRAGCLTLKDNPGVVHIGLFASKEFRVARTSVRYRIGAGEAEEWVDTMDMARAAWFKHLADKDPRDRSIYDLALDVTNPDGDEGIARSVSEAAMEVRFGVLPMEHQTLPV